MPAPTTGPADTAVSGQPKEGEGAQPEPTRDRRAEKRIASLTRKNDEAQREIGYWRGIAEASKGQAPPQQPQPDARPQAAQFKSYDEFVEALTDWKTDQKLKARDSEREQQTRHQEDTGKASERNARLAERLVQSGKGIEGFEDVMADITEPTFPISATMRDYLEESANPAHMAQWMADNRAEARKIYGLNSAAAVRALEKVEAQIAPKPAPNATKAPPPVPTVGGRTVTQADPAKMSMDEYAAYWSAREAARNH
jgi:hypothetical protein